MEIIFNAAGGLALFILAMGMMTDGLKTFIGSGLKTFLQKSTSSLLRGIFSGALVTGLVQSSSAVTVATIGFVNAGFLSLNQALGVIFGSNIGTTMTAWLVSLVGFGWKIETFAMPILAFGVFLYFISSRKKYQALGKALTGFGLFFLGLSILNGAFSGIAETYGTEFLNNGQNNIFMYILVGFIVTFLTQSSSAAIAIILMAANESVIGVTPAAAAIIGANLGTTSTAIIASINATANAKRAAAGHVAFNLITGIAALMILPLLLLLTSKFGHFLGIGVDMDDNKVTFLALFHTVFNIFGVIIIFPFTKRLALFLNKLFKTEEDLSRPQFLDKTVSATPILAISALSKELSRLNNLVCTITLSILHNPHLNPKTIKRKSEAIFSLGATIYDFATTVGMGNMTKEISEELADMIRITRYLEESANILPEMSTLLRRKDNIKNAETKQLLEKLITETTNIVTLFQKEDENHDKLILAMDKFQNIYQKEKENILTNAAAQKLSPEKADKMLDRLSQTRRMIEQMNKTNRLLGKYTKKTNDKLR